MSVCYLCLNFVFAASNTILSYIWQWYVTSFAHKSVKDHILNPIHTSLLLLPWQNYWPNVTDLDFMFKVNEGYYMFALQNILYSLVKVER